MAVIEAGPMTILWKRSSGVPIVWATRALMGSAWLTATTALPGWRLTKRATAEAMRACISVKDSPPGKRKPLGCRWMIGHSARLLACFSERPVHCPMSRSARSPSMRTMSPRASAMGAAVSRARSSGEAYTAARPGILASRAAAASACRRPSSERCKPRARPGSLMPVVAVTPCRTRITRVGFGDTNASLLPLPDSLSPSRGEGRVRGPLPSPLWGEREGPNIPSPLWGEGRVRGPRDSIPAMTSPDLGFTPATELAALIRAKKLSSVELTKATLERIERLNPKLNAFVTVTADLATEAAKKAEQVVMKGGALGPLTGVPFSIKDLAVTAGVPTKFGSFIHEK